MDDCTLNILKGVNTETMDTNTKEKDNYAIEQEKPWYLDREEIMKKKMEVFNHLKSSFPNLLEGFSGIDKEIKLKISYPFRRISDFIVLQQATLSFRDKEGYKKHRLYLQKILVSPERNPEIQVRIIWARDKKFLINTDSRVNPELMNTLLKIGTSFGLFSPKMVDFPFSKRD